MIRLFCLVILLASCQKQNPCTQFEGEAMTMPYKIIVGKPLSKKARKEVAKVIEETFAEAFKTFDLRNPNSEISKINDAPKNTLIPLSFPMQQILTVCQKVFELSGNRFDPTIEPLEHSPCPKEQEAISEFIGWNHLSIQNGIIKKSQTETRIDLGGIAKGFCVDLLVERLMDLGIEHLFVEWFGDFRAAGHHPTLGDWLVQINPALTIGKQPIAPIALRDTALSTCKNIDLFDPLTLSQVETTPFSVAFACVLAPTCALADALSTTSVLFPTRKEAESWAQEVVEKYPDVRFWILSYR